MADTTIVGLKKRLRTVTSTRKITGAMELVASSSYQKARILLERNEQHFEAFKEIVDEITSASFSEEAPTGLYFNSPDPDAPTLYLLLTSNTGLCGNYNSSIGRTAEDLAEYHLGEPWFIATGMRGLSELERKISPDRLEYHILGDLPSYDEIGEMFNRTLELYRNGEVSEINIVYNNFKTALSTDVHVDMLLPLHEPDKRKKSSGQYDFEPSAEEMQRAVYTMFLKEKLYNSLLQAKTAEHFTRKRAMNSANKNAEEILSTLKVQLNRIRQTSITQELTEIVGGAEALN